MLLRWNYGLYFTWWDRWMRTEHPEYRSRLEGDGVRYRSTGKPAARHSG